MQKPKRQRRPASIESHLPVWLRLWWQLTARGFDAWRCDVWIVIAWVFAIGALLMVSPLALFGLGCRFVVVTFRAVAAPARSKRKAKRRVPVPRFGPAAALTFRW